MANIVEEYDMQNKDCLYEGYSLIKQITIDWDIETPIDMLINEDEYKLVDANWCGHTPTLTLEVIPELATVAKAINAFSCSSDEELCNEDKLAIIARLSMKLAIVLDGIHEYYLEQAEKSEPEDPMIDDQYGSDFDDNDFIDACDACYGCLGSFDDCKSCKEIEKDKNKRLYKDFLKILKH